MSEAPRKWLPVLLAAILCLLFPPPGAASGGAPLPVTVSIPPQKYFVEKIGGPLVEIEVMVAPGADPHQYEPKPRQVAALSRSRIYFACGVPFETFWLSKIAAANPKMAVVHTDREIEKRPIEAHSHHGHEESEPPGGGHDEEDAQDPHIWLSPPLVMLQARAIFAALADADPQNLPTYEANYKNFISELADLDVSLRRLLHSGEKERYFMVFHPAWGYFADAYGLRQYAVQVEGREPRAKDLDKFIKLARELRVTTIFVQPEYSPRSAQTIADAVGGKLVQANPLAPDWAENLRRVAAQIAAALGPR